MDYCVPRADDLPSFVTDQTVTPTPVNPLGAKGIGEAATIGSTPAVVNAVVDALQLVQRPAHRHAAPPGARVAGDAPCPGLIEGVVLFGRRAFVWFERP